jgi:phosphoglycolate phosphatase-like HAD superfamily hydrolase
MIKAIHIYDMDGVLVDTSHRYRNLPDGTIDLTYWLENARPEKIALDTLLPLAEQYKADIANPEIYVVICTARQAIKADFDYIANRLGNPDKIICRPIGNSESDAKLKRRGLCKLLNLKQFQKITRKFWDDNRKNLDAVADLGLQLIHVKSKICEVD